MTSLETKVIELNEKFKVNLKKWNEYSQEQYEDENRIDALINSSEDNYMKKDFIFILVKNGAGQEYIHALGNSFIIKDELKEIGFNFTSNHPVKGVCRKGWNLFTV